MKASKIILISLLIFVFSIFMFIKQMMTVSPGTSSGNGNPALLFMILLVPLFFVIVMMWVQIFQVHSVPIRYMFISMFFMIIHLTAGFFYQKQSLEKYRDVLKNAYFERDGMVDMQYIQDITTGMTIHVNNQYFNLNTFFMFVTTSVFIAALFYLLQRFESRTKTDR